MNRVFLNISLRVFAITSDKLLSQKKYYITLNIVR